MKKLLIVLGCLLMLLSGCGDSKEDEIVTSKEMTIEDLYGIWTIGSVEYNGSTFTIAEAEAMGDYSLSGVYIVLKEGGGAFCCILSEDYSGTTSWKYDEENQIVMIESAEYKVEGDQLVVEADNGLLNFEKYSSSQDITDIPSLEGFEDKDEVEVAKDEEVEAAYEEKEEVEEPVVNNDEIRPEIKEAIDAYETFVDEYCAFMEEYAKDSGNLTLLTQYANMVSKLSSMESKMDALEGDLTDAEYYYYTEVLLRCNEKMLKVIY